MADNGDFKLQISYKLGPNYADMLNIRADDEFEFESKLVHVRNNLVGLLSEVGELLRAAGAAAPLTVPQQAAPASDIPPTNAPVGYSNGAQTTCQHGLRKRVVKPNWTGWFCDTPQGTPGQCKPSFEDKQR